MLIDLERRQQEHHRRTSSTCLYQLHTYRTQPSCLSLPHYLIRRSYLISLRQRQAQQMNHSPTIWLSSYLFNRLTTAFVKGCETIIISIYWTVLLRSNANRRLEERASEGVFLNTRTHILYWFIILLYLITHITVYHLQTALRHWRTALGSDRDQSTEATSGVIYTRPYVSPFATPFAHSSVIHTHELNIYQRRQSSS